MCTTGQLLIYGSPEGEAELPTCDLCFSLSYLACGNHRCVSRAIARTAIPRFIILVPSHRATSFKCRARAREGTPVRLPVAGTDWTEKSSERVARIGERGDVPAKRRGVDQDGFMLIPAVRINARMSVHNVRINGNKLRLGEGRGRWERVTRFSGVSMSGTAALAVK